MADSDSLEEKLENLEIQIKQLTDENDFLRTKDALRDQLENDVSEDKISLKQSAEKILNRARRIINFGCGEYFSIVKADGTLPKKGEILNPRDKEWYWKWISGVGYTDKYFEEAEATPAAQIATYVDEPPYSVFNADFEFKPLIVLNNKNHMLSMEETGRVVEDYLAKTKKVYLDRERPDIGDLEELDPEEQAEIDEWFSKEVYQIHVCATRNVAVLSPHSTFIFIRRTDLPTYPIFVLSK